MGLVRQRDEMKQKISNLEREIEAFRAVGNVRKSSKSNRFGFGTPLTSKLEQKIERPIEEMDKENISIKNIDTAAVN